MKYEYLQVFVFVFGWQLDYCVCFVVFFVLEYVKIILQEFVYYGEGDVWMYMMMVIDVLFVLFGYWMVLCVDQEIVFLVVLLYDIVKLSMMVVDFVIGVIGYFGYLCKGVIDVCIVLWDVGVLFVVCEVICWMIVVYQVLFFVMSGLCCGMFEFIVCELLWQVSLLLLCLFVEVDICGCICNDMQCVFDNIELWCELVWEDGCYGQLCVFVDVYIVFSYFCGVDVYFDYLLFCMLGLLVVVMVGLLVLGKNMWVVWYYLDLLVVLFDDVCDVLGLCYGCNEGVVVYYVVDVVKVLLCDWWLFVWNVMNLLLLMCKKMFDLLYVYGVDVMFVYFEWLCVELLCCNVWCDMLLMNWVFEVMLLCWDLLLLIEVYVVCYEV